ncbi:MAG: MBL fold metallo-hydrolase [Gammaproteobacteria bacterium]|nr:MBL fold metallo-hydrolase [Gammaproteobacteria bacterium]
MNPIALGDIEVSRVEELIWTISPRFLFPQLSYEDFEPHRDWLVPHFSTEALKMRLSIHTFVVRTAHHTIIVDTCVGNHKKRDIPLWNDMQSDYLARLQAAGVDPEDVDYVMCTHMHVDHVGWHTRLANGAWVPTFPNAKYLFHQREWDHWAASEDENQREVLEDSLIPIMDRGLAVMVDDDFAIEDTIRLEPTPGHTPGHCSIQIGADHTTRGVITGDMIHHPVQIPHPEWTSRVCWDKGLSARTRHDFLARYADTDTVILGTHFAPPTALHVVSNGGKFSVR